MKSNLNKICLVFLIGIMSNYNSQAQDLSFDDFLRAGSEDAGTLMGNYISPFMRGFGYGMAGGWYNTAKPHKSFGFDLTATVSLAKVPTSELLYTFRNADYNSISLASGTSAELPTIFGGKTTQQLQSSLTQTVQGQSVTASQVFPAPEGIDIEDVGGYVPTPMLQLGIGLIKNTDLKIRYVPTVSTDDYKVSLIGFGLMHDIKQWIPGIKQVPIDLSVFVGYTKLNTDFKLAGAVAGANQAAKFDVTALTYQVLVSKKFSILTLYGGLGFNSVTSKLKMSGTYILPADLPTTPGAPTLPDIVLTDPVDLSFDSSGARATIGARLKLAILTLHADYTLQEYNTITAGVGFSLR
jgi:hypothetical protein